MPHTDSGVTDVRQETVVLLHASASSSRQWEGLRQVLEPHLAVRAIDLHGHGECPAWRGTAPLTLADEAALVAPLLEEAGGAHLVGHSYGGAVALKLASMYPRLVRSVIAYEPVMFGWLSGIGDGRGPASDIVAVADAMRTHLRAGHEDAAAQHFIDFWSGAGAWQSLSSRTAEVDRRAGARRAPQLRCPVCRTAAAGRARAQRAAAVDPERYRHRCRHPQTRGADARDAPACAARVHARHGTHGAAHSRRQVQRPGGCTASGRRRMPTQTGKRALHWEGADPGPSEWRSRNGEESRKRRGQVRRSPHV